MKSPHRTHFLFVALFLIALCTVIILPPPTARAAQRPVTGHPLSQQASQPIKPHPFLSKLSKPQIIAANANSSSNLILHGGSVLENNESLYAIFWEPTNNVANGYNALIERFLGDFGSSPLYQIAHQYGDSSLLAPTSAIFAGAWVDNGAYPQSPLFDSNIQQEVTHAQQVNGWPQTSPNNIFFVFTQSGAVICMDTSEQFCTNGSVCGWHNIFNGSVVYAALPYVSNNLGCNPSSSPNNNDADWTINVASHEEMEADTDPQIHAWFDSSGEEVGDKCAWHFGPLDVQGGDTVLNGNEYILQEEWDNYTSSCRMTPSTTILPGTWPICAYENLGHCSPLRPELLTFGANGGYAYFDVGVGPVSCNSSTLGDPNNGTYKACYFWDLPPTTNEWSQCSSENGTCIFNGSTMTVAYGANGKFHFGTVTNGIACNNATFGDPIPGTVKACYMMAPPPGTVTWTLCANDGGNCFYPGNGGTHEVAFGANGLYIYRSVTEGAGSGYPCNTSVWGDPDPGVAKACYWASTTI